MVQQLIQEHKAMREMLVKMVGTDDRTELTNMQRMLPLVTSEIRDPELRKEKEKIHSVIQVLLDVPYRDERVGLTGIL